MAAKFYFTDKGKFIRILIWLWFIFYLSKGSNLNFIKPKITQNTFLNFYLKYKIFAVKFDLNLALQ